ncbi:hypothetical protein [Spongiivirga citrea]|uniref:Uncharacterized protein n=1 Tax=Spongiivirga citrea TaxID=1481457 RepID=A0A6M0CGZ8_9FLAO|nr:hypothetical protein [Spongiivirga citrea]NER16752.1 hypothetical protein [Spongiivirga citrea]
MKRIFKALLKILGIFIGLLIVASIVIYFIYNEPLPEGKSGAKADALAEKMLIAVDQTSYRNTRFLEWTFAGVHTYKWDKEMGLVDVTWDTYKAALNLNDPIKSKVYKNGTKLIGDASEKQLQKAIDYFNNDSFWLVAPFKIFDKGTTRAIVDSEDGSKGLLVTYGQGGSTPGDSYLWKLNDNGFPQSYKMWVKIIPIGGVEATWDDWKIVQSGARLPASHQLSFMELSISNLKGYN